MQGILKRMEKAKGMRDDAVQGEFWSWPKIDKTFCFFKFANGKMRLIETAKVTRIICKMENRVEFETLDGRFLLDQY
jgi:hypothetical protein